jgi:hypothetical protein
VSDPRAPIVERLRRYTLDIFSREAVARTVLLVLQSGTFLIPELMTQPPEEVFRAWQVLLSAGSIESAGLAVRGLNADTRQAVVSLFMSAVEAFGRGEHVLFSNVSLDIPDWLVDLCRKS